jgi:hypothetical protein
MSEKALFFEYRNAAYLEYVSNETQKNDAFSPSSCNCQHALTSIWLTEEILIRELFLLSFYNRNPLKQNATVMKDRNGLIDSATFFRKINRLY